MVTCEKCGKDYETPEWPFCPHGLPIGSGLAVIDDQLEGGPRVFDTMEGEPFIESKSQWRREMEVRNLVQVDRHDRDYYRRRFKRHDEELRELGHNREY